MRTRTLLSIRTVVTLLLLPANLGSLHAAPLPAPSAEAVAPICDPGSVLYEIRKDAPPPAGLDNAVVLTFDDGPDALGITDSVLDTLAHAGVPATFFVNTDAHVALLASTKAQQTLRRIRRDGHLLGNHTASHPELAALDAAAVAAQLDDAEDAVRVTLGEQALNLTLMRAPYGRPFNPEYRLGPDAADFCRVASVVAPRAVHVYWQLDPNDWDTDDADVVVARVEALVAPRADGSRGARGVLLLHSNQPATAAALPRILRLLHGLGVQVVDLETYVTLAFGAPSAQLVRR